MENDNQTPKKKYNLRKRKNKKKVILSSDSEQSDEEDSDYFPGDSGGEDPDFKLRDWQRFVGKMFPSVGNNKRLKELDKLDKLQDKGKTKAKRKRKVKKEEKEEEEEEESTEEEYTDEEYIEDDMLDVLNNQNMKVNVIFTVAEYPEDDEYYEGEDEFEIEEEDSTEEEEDEDEEEITKKKNKKNKKENKKKCKKENKKENKKEITSEDMLQEFKELLEIRKKDGKESMVKQLEKFISIQEKQDKKKQRAANKKKKLENNKVFRKLLYSNNVMCDMKYFRGLDVKKQTLIIEQMKEIKKHSQLTKPYRIALLETDIPEKYKISALNKINTLTHMDRASGEYYKIKQWVDTFMQIPFGKYKALPITMENGQDKCQEFMDNAHQQLDQAVYGLDDAKMQIMQMIGQWISNPKSVGNAIAIHGPMGTGKTTLVKEGISKVLQRPFAFLALGGATDSSFLEGHSYTYEGSVWGRIVEIILQSKCMNPVIYFDELDKVSDTPKGEEIIGILTHLTDTTQNSQFHDKYFSGIDFDLSKALFIFSYNDEKKVNAILRDRMYRIETKGYQKEQKTIIAKNYLIPTIEKNINFNKEQIKIPTETLHHIIEQYTGNEKGVRNLKRCLEIIYSKLNLFRLMKPGHNLFNDKMTTLKIEFPFNVTKDIVNKLIKRNNDGDIPFGLYM